MTARRRPRRLPRSLAVLYRALWLLAAAATGLVGIACATTSVGPVGLATSLGLGALGGAGCYWMFVHELAPAPVPLRGSALGGAVLLAAAATGVLVGLASVFGAAGATVALVVLGLSPAALRTGARHRPWTAHGATPPLSRWSTPELRDTWRASSALLASTAGVEERLLTVRLREQVLTELEWRDPSLSRRLDEEVGGDVDLARHLDLPPADD